MAEYRVGGFDRFAGTPTKARELFMSEPLEAAALTNGLQKDSKYPLLIAADFERGLSMRLKGATAFPAAMAFTAPRATKSWRANRPHRRFRSRAPSACNGNDYDSGDLNSNPANPIIDTRSFRGRSSDGEQNGCGLHRGRAPARDC